MASARDPFSGRTELEWEELQATGRELLTDRTAAHHLHRSEQGPGANNRPAALGLQ